MYGRFRVLFRPMLGLTGGELFVVAFIFVAVVSASWWPRAGERIALALSGKPEPEPPPHRGGPA
jgi:hypothetical protein